MCKKTIFILVIVLLGCNVCFLGEAEEESGIEFSPTYLFETDFEKEPFYMIKPDDEAQLTKLLDRSDTLEINGQTRQKIT